MPRLGRADALIIVSNAIGAGGRHDRRAQRVASIIESNTTAAINEGDEALATLAPRSPKSQRACQRQEDLAEVNSRIDRAKAFLSELAALPRPRRSNRP